MAFWCLSNEEKAKLSKKRPQGKELTKVKGNFCKDSVKAPLKKRKQFNFPCFHCYIFHQIFSPEFWMGGRKGGLFLILLFLFSINESLDTSNSEYSQNQ